MSEQHKKQKKKLDRHILKRLFTFAKPYKVHFVGLVLLTVGLGVLAPVRPFLVEKTIDQYIVPGDFEGLNFMLILLIGLTLFQALVQFSHTYISGWLGQHVIRDIRVKLYEHILKLKLSFYDQTPIGRLVTRTVSDIETLSEVFSNGVAALIGDLLQLFFILLLMFYTDWKLTLVCLSVLPILLYSTYIFKEKIKSSFHDVRTAVANLNTFVQEHITGMNIVQIFNSEKREQEKFEQINEEHKKANLRSVMYYSVYYPVAEVISASSTGLLVWYGAREVLSADIQVGTMVAFIMYIGQFFRPIRMIADRFNTLQMGVVSTERIFDLLDIKDAVQSEGKQKPEKIEGHIKFDEVFFAYNDENYVLKDINFEMHPGDKIAFVGATGAGKSSIINLLNRFYEIQKGQIFLDGKEIHEYDLSYLRQHIGIVLQDVFLFSDTIRNNITLGNTDITDEQIMKAAELVGAKDFIEKLPGTLNYNVMERGSTLSVGQRQLISFVRAMVYDPKILILDEATSSVDSETEELIQRAVHSMMEGRTSIAIAHRLATIKEADKIIVLDKGEIKEVGSHDELLAKGGFYARLYEIQYKEVV
ncbi:ABC transporter ATP-binding protein [Sediminitomix flava]|uniref:ATP-binding cassette subfamily B protein n=1 Tax=Sediminitomix flava TaxID=379075 RepID=A0A315ZHK2_SEDFL|nr:ABC transporter ATP-binding protein [Sediminitomix flava]PWJ44772.1 ATP-binding cassette subfamily B protein [Sediminitomix flava]